MTMIIAVKFELVLHVSIDDHDHHMHRRIKIKEEKRLELILSLSMTIGFSLTRRQPVCLKELFRTAYDESWLSSQSVSELVYGT